MNQIDDIKQRLHMFKVGQNVQQLDMATDIEYLLNVLDIVEKEYKELLNKTQAIGEHLHD